jgi:2-phosphosulfolactate phosphatase
VAIDCFPERLDLYPLPYTVVAVDVIRTTTTALTGVRLGRRCLPVPTLESVDERAAMLEEPILVGELGGYMPFGFDVNNSPTALEARRDDRRPMVLLSTSGTRLVCGPARDQVVLAASLRNYRATISHLVGLHDRVVVIGAGARGEFREEDELCCAWIAEGLAQAGYELENAETRHSIARWHGASVSEISVGKSAKYLQDTGQHADLEYVLSHVDDVDQVLVRQADDELVLVEVGSRAP